MAGIGDLGKEIRSRLGFDSEEGFIGRLDIVFQDLNNRATDVNKTFLQNRERISDIKNAIADASPSVLMFGGKMEDVSRTMSEAAEAANRNVLLATDQVARLYGASKILGQSTEFIVSNFLDVGTQLNNISGDIEKSINYIQSIGANAKEVMTDVLQNTQALNKFNFEDGVQGLTRMAAKASMLRFDMRETLSFAEKLSSPEMAIETASAFQRLGVAAGTLVDPFALMYKSISDPEGLQDALANLAKRFVEFNEETGNFKINPAGILQMREIANQANISYNEFAKLALSSAEFDKRLSEISFEYKGNKEDLMYLANMAQFKGGEYVVTIRGEEKALREVTAEEFLELKKIQEKSPKTLEDIARGQLSLTENIAADLSAIASKILLGITSEESIQRLAEEIRRGERVAGKVVFEGIPEVSELREIASGPINYLKDTAMSLFKGMSGTLTEEDVTRNEKLRETMGKEFFDKLAGSFSESMTKSLNDIIPTLDKERTSDKLILDLIKNQTDALKDLGVKNIDLTQKMETKTIEQNIKSSINVDGQISHKIDVPVGISNDELQRILNNVFSSEQFKKQIIDIYKDIPKQSVTGE